MCFYGPGLDRGFVRSRWQRFIIGQCLQSVIKFDRSIHHSLKGTSPGPGFRRETCHSPTPGIHGVPGQRVLGLRASDHGRRGGGGREELVSESDSTPNTPCTVLASGSSATSCSPPVVYIGMSSTGVPDDPHASDGTMREYVGLVWVGDEPGHRLSIWALSHGEARDRVIA